MVGTHHSPQKANSQKANSQEANSQKGNHFHHQYCIDIVLTLFENNNNNNPKKINF
jgi:hypothetical protein